MAIKSQIRLEQLTGSIGNADGKIRTDSAPKTLALVGASDLSGSLSAIASALGRIHGRASNEAFNNVAGTFYQTIVPDSSGGRDLGSTSAEWGDLYIADDKKIQLGSDQDFTLEYDSAGGQNVALAEGAHFRLGSAQQQLQFLDSGLKLYSPQDGRLLVFSDGTSSSALEFQSAGGIKAAASGSSTVALADGVFTLDLNGTDVVDGLLVDAEGTATIQAAAADSGAIVLNAESANGMIQLQNQGSEKLVISASQVVSMDQTRIQDVTAAASVGTGALIVDGGASVGLDLYVGDDVFLKSDGAVLSLGAGDDVKITHDGSTGAKVSSAGDFFIDGAAVVDVNAASAAGLAGTTLVLSASSGAATIAATAASSFSTSDGAITVNGKTGLNLQEDGTDILAIDTSRNVTVGNAAVIDIDGSGAISIDSSGGAISVGADNVAQNISIGTAGARTLIALGNASATETQIEGTLVDVNWGASGGLFAGAGPAILDSTASAAIISGSLAVALSGSSISFSTDGAMTSAGGPMAGNMAFALNHQEFVDFRGKAIYDAGTSIIGAFNKLADASAGGTLGKLTITGSNVQKLQLSGLSTQAGYATSIDVSEMAPVNTEVFVNGQLLVSGTGNAGVGGDYGVEYITPGVLNFQFKLQPDDVVVVKTTADQ